MGLNSEVDEGKFFVPSEDVDLLHCLGIDAGHAQVYQRFELTFGQKEYFKMSRNPGLLLFNLFKITRENELHGFRMNTADYVYLIYSIRENVKKRKRGLGTQQALDFDAHLLKYLDKCNRDPTALVSASASDELFHDVYPAVHARITRDYERLRIT